MMGKLYIKDISKSDYKEILVKNRIVFFLGVRGSSDDDGLDIRMAEDISENLYDLKFTNPIKKGDIYLDYPLKTPIQVQVADGTENAGELVEQIINCYTMLYRDRNELLDSSVDFNDLVIDEIAFCAGENIVVYVKKDMHSK